MKIQKRQQKQYLFGFGHRVTVKVSFIIPLSAVILPFIIGPKVYEVINNLWYYFIAGMMLCVVFQYINMKLSLQKRQINIVDYLIKYGEKPKGKYD